MSKITITSDRFGPKRWYNVTEQFEIVRKLLAPGELVKAPSFTMHSATVFMKKKKIVEIGEKADPGISENVLYFKDIIFGESEVNKEEKKKDENENVVDKTTSWSSLDELYQQRKVNRITLPSQINKDELIGTMDEMIRLLWSFFSGNADRFSTFTCLYLHNEVRFHHHYKLPHPLLFPFVNAILLTHIHIYVCIYICISCVSFFFFFDWFEKKKKNNNDENNKKKCSHYVRQLVKSASVNEEEDWCRYEFYDIKSLPDLEETLLALDKQGVESANGTGREEKEGNELLLRQSIQHRVSFMKILLRLVSKLHFCHTFFNEKIDHATAQEGQFKVNKTAEETNDLKNDEKQKEDDKGQNKKNKNKNQNKNKKLDPPQKKKDSQGEKDANNPSETQTQENDKDSKETLSLFVLDEMIYYHTLKKKL
ncbi:hypothetical protein RFI_04274 [Reticulomyxa filosa]|uniref:Uncharacterized protein n=1 Tax=Reticulomyxa filosa TaxID=46433 RepID=X6P5G7_RETFI|nr:hypothetical protein RFI_04274 [Reticulomyxa filosa]|eukprot:ETO32842.1 hypothetical protein RFI_04274 [Reticulomyxa filosa]